MRQGFAHAGLRSLAWTALAAGVASPVAADDTLSPARAASFSATRAADLELATIGYRLATGNVELCQLKQAQFGMPIHAITQYDPQMRADARVAFGFASVIAVEAVVPGGPAEAAGLRPGDSLAAIDGVPQPALADARATVDVSDRETAQAALNRGGPTRRRVLRVLRGGVAQDIGIVPKPGCRLTPELLIGIGMEAQSDGVHLQIGDGYLRRYDADTVALVVAHEMAHNILHHYDQLRRDKPCRGTPNQTRRTEGEADRLSVALLANAGYDPALPGQFWRGRGKGLQLFSIDRDHGGPTQRAEATEAAAKTLRRTPRGSYYPPDYQQMLASTRRAGC